MAWTVPSGCYYAVRIYNLEQQGWSWNYYSAGQSVADSVSPLSGTLFILTDFTNGYIYTTEDDFEITCNGNAFTVTYFNIPFINSSSVHVIASDNALDWFGIRVIGDLTFGDGTNLKNKTDICNATYNSYDLTYSFHGRTDITTFSLPVGVDRLYNAFTGCTNLQTVYGSVESATDLNSCFMGCSSLTILPTFATSAPDDKGLDMARCFEGCTSLVAPPDIPENTYSLHRCFYGCTSLTTAPSIPSTGYIPIEDDPDEPSIYGGLSQCFYGCTSLTTVPALPNLNVGLHQTFYGCTSLVTAPVIPSNITSIIQTFYGCTSLTGEVEINTNKPTEQQCLDLFTGTVNDIMLSGSSQLINSIASQYNNVYIWSLSSTLTAQRNEQTPTSINISVDVSRFKTGTLSSLNLYRDNSSTPLSVTWNDPTLSIDSIPETFTTTLANISESDTLILTVIATDTYGSSQASSVKIPISFYTMDVQAGGKEIAFGGLANDDLTDYPTGFDTSSTGVFKCNMTLVNIGMAGEIKMWAGNTVPTGWLFCDGSAVSRADYPLLFNAIGTLWGEGDGSTTFNLPNLQGRTPVGASSSTFEWVTIIGEGGGDFVIDSPVYARFGDPATNAWVYATMSAGTYTATYASLVPSVFPSDPAPGIAKTLQVQLNVGSTAGTSEQNLTVAEMPSHNHTQNSHNHSQNAHHHYIYTSTFEESGSGTTHPQVRNSGTAYNSSSTTATNIANTATNNPSGGGKVHSIMQPFAVVKYIICAI